MQGKVKFEADSDAWIEECSLFRYKDRFLQVSMFEEIIKYIQFLFLFIFVKF